jgi:hypothetical protein
VSEFAKGRVNLCRFPGMISARIGASIDAGFDNSGNMPVSTEYSIHTAAFTRHMLSVLGA